MATPDTADPGPGATAFAKQIDGSEETKKKVAEKLGGAPWQPPISTASHKLSDELAQTDGVVRRPHKPTWRAAARFTIEPRFIKWDENQPAGHAADIGHEVDSDQGGTESGRCRPWRRARK